MADSNKIIPGIVIGIAVTIAAQILKTYAERPATLSAEVMATSYTPQPGQAPPNTSCLVSVNVHNNTPKPARNISIVADYAVSFSRAPARSNIITGSTSKDQQPYVIDILAPGAARRVFLLTTYPCDFEEYSHPGMRVFNEEGSASIRYIVPPSGWMALINEYIFISIPAMLMGAFVLLLIFVGGIIDVVKKLSELTKKQSTPPAAG